MATTEVEPRLGRLGGGMIALGGTLFCAAVIILLDVVFHGSLMFATLICPLWFLVAVVRTLVQRPRLGIAAGRVLIPVATFLLVAANSSLQTTIATANAVRIVEACEQYNQANGNYPQQLDDLVPSYLSSIPRAKYCLAWGDFQYFSTPDIQLLVWVQIPPFGQWVYGFDGTRDWRYID